MSYTILDTAVFVPNCRKRVGLLKKKEEEEERKKKFILAQRCEMAEDAVILGVGVTIM